MPPLKWTWSPPVLRNLVLKHKHMATSTAELLPVYLDHLGNGENGGMRQGNLRIYWASFPSAQGEH